MRTSRVIGIGFVLIAGLMIFAADAAAQPAATSFNELAATLTSGQDLIVHSGAGRGFHGRLASITGDQIELERIRWFRRQRRTFTESEVFRIDEQDSTWDGKGKGAAFGLLTVIALVKLPACNTPDNFTCLMPDVLAIPVGMMIGDAIDRSVNRAVFQASSHLVARLSPVAGHGRSGLALTLRWN
jgi:hypothetical protein